MIQVLACQEEEGQCQASRDLAANVGPLKLSVQPLVGEPGNCQRVLSKDVWNKTCILSIPGLFSAGSGAIYTGFTIIFYYQRKIGVFEGSESNMQACKEKQLHI